jgi:hypothetical protein
MITPNVYYTYAYLRVDGTPYYIGKGKGKRAWSRGGRSIRPPKDTSRILVLKEGLTEQEAFKHEVYMIAVLGRKDLGTGILHNKTNGGEGVSGYSHTDEAKKNIGKAQVGLLNTNYGNPGAARHITGLSGENSPNWGITRTKEFREKAREVKMGEKNPMYGVKGENNHSSKKVQCLTTGEIYASAAEASEKTGVCRMLIGKCCRGERKTTKGLEWGFA